MPIQKSNSMMRQARQLNALKITIGTEMQKIVKRFREGSTEIS